MGYNSRISPQRSLGVTLSKSLHFGNFWLKKWRTVFDMLIWTMWYKRQSCWTYVWPDNLTPSGSPTFTFFTTEWPGLTWNNCGKTGQLNKKSTITDKHNLQDILNALTLCYKIIQTSKLTHLGITVLAISTTPLQPWSSTNNVRWKANAVPI